MFTSIISSILIIFHLKNIEDQNPKRKFHPCTFALKFHLNGFSVSLLFLYPHLFIKLNCYGK